MCFVLEKIIEVFVEKVIQSLWRQLGCLIHYNQNVKTLEDEKNKLQTARRTVQEKIDEAKIRGEVIENSVSVWQNEADQLTQGVETFMQEKVAEENVKCFEFLCPNISSWYKLSKEAKKKICEVKTHAENANFDKISHPAPAPPELQLLSSGEYMDFDSRAAVFDMIIKALEDPSVTMIGVHGTGGVGKTTLVKKVGDQVKKDGLFDEVVIAVVSQTADIGKIQDEIAARLNLKWDEETVVRRAIQLWNRLDNERKNLVILDDIWGELEWQAIGIPITGGNKGCKVVLTSRNRRVLKEVCRDFEEAYRDFPIEVLSEEDAWNLFKKKVGNIVDSHGPLHDTAREVCKECGGLPVAICAVAAALKDKNLADWKRSLDKLKKSMLNNIKDMDKRLFTSLKLSYDFLSSEDEKSCFLLCCSFPEDAQISVEELARYYMTRRSFGDQYDLETLEDARDAVGSVVDTLKNSCLLLDGVNDDFVKMHDVVRDVAILIAKEERAFLAKHGVEKWPETEAYEKFSAISLRSEAILEFPDELVCPELHTLVLKFSNRKFWGNPELSIEIPDKFFRRTEKLMVLELDGVTMLDLPSSLENLTKLQILWLNNCKLGDITMLKCLKNKLEVLSLRCCKIEALPYELRELTHLRLLDLRDCGELEVIPNGVISNLVQLEELHFPSRFKNWEEATGNEERSKVSLDELTSLNRLSTLSIWVQYLRRLPVDIFLRNLIRFFVIVGGYTLLAKYSSRQGVMRIEGLWSDDDLNIWERLLGKPKWFNNLTELVIDNCGSLKYLFTPSSARELQQLQSLVIGKGEILESVIGNEGETDEEIIENVINFSQLKILELQFLPCLISFYKKATTGSPSLPLAQGLFNEKVAFHALEKLRIVSVQNITEICDKSELPTKLFGQLRSLEIDYCEKLINVASSLFLPLVLNMESLKIKMCPAMEVIVVLEKRGEETQEATNNDIIQFPKLTKMTLEKLENLKGFCAYGFEDQLHFNMQVAFKADSSSTRLQIKDTFIITETRPLFNHKVAFPALEQLTIVSMPNITEIWDKNDLPTQSFCLLRSLKVRKCDKLMNVIPSHMLPVLQNIRSLIIEKFSEMEVIVVLEKRDKETQEATNKDIVMFPKLEKMELRKLKNLKGVCAYKSEGQLNFDVQSTFPALEKLQIESLPLITAIWGMQTSVVPEKLAKSSFSQSRINDIFLVTETRPLFNHQVPFLALESLYIDSMPNLKEIWDKNVLPAKLFGQLKTLSVQDCERLINAVPSHMLPVIQNIVTLDVFSCLEMEVIIVLEKREDDTKEATNKDIIEFPKLDSLVLQNLEKLKSVCAYKSGDQLYFNVQVAFPTLSTRDECLHLDLDGHSAKIFKEAISGNKEMMDAFTKWYSWMISDDSEDEDVLEDEDEDTNKKDKAGPSEERSTEAETRTPIPNKDDSQDDSMDEDEETPKADLSQKSLIKAAIKSLVPEEDDLENEDNSRDEDEETPKKAGTSERKPIESATKAPIMGEGDKEDEDKETPKKAKVAQRELDD